MDEKLDQPKQTSDVESCANILVRIVAMAFVFAIALSIRLWTGCYRGYPTAPLFEVLDFSFPASDMVVLAMLLASLLILAMRASTLSAKVATALIVVMFLFDQTRVQPWAFQYLLMVAGFAFTPKTAAGRADFLSGCRLMIPFIYIWSGLHKMNPFYVTETFPWLISGITHGVPINNTPLSGLAIASAIIESIMGVGLLCKRSRKIAVMVCMCMHGVILACIGPTGLNWNTVVWPWNIAMMALVVLLFADTEQPAAWKLFAQSKSYSKIIIATVVLMPALSFAGLWDNYLSFSLYSGANAQATLSMNEDTYHALPDNLKRITSEAPSGRHILAVQQWCLSEVNVPPYPEERVFKGIGLRFASLYAKQPGDVRLVIRDRPDGLKKVRNIRSIDLPAPPH